MLLAEENSDLVSLVPMLSDDVVGVATLVESLDVIPIDDELPPEVASAEGVLVVEVRELVLFSNVELSKEGPTFDSVAIEVVLKTRLLAGLKVSIVVKLLEEVVL